jgi:cytochrome c5
MTRPNVTPDSPAPPSASLRLFAVAAALGVALTGAAAALAAAPPPPGPGLDLINQRCVHCHPAAQIFAAPRRSPEEWRRTVKKMAARGAELSPEDVAEISAYLGKNFSPPT